MSDELKSLHELLTRLEMSLGAFRVHEACPYIAEKRPDPAQCCDVPGSVTGSFEAAHCSSGMTALRLIDTVIAARTLRTKFFERDLFFDPAWSILIDLYRAQLSGSRLSVSAVCYGSGVAETTALRYIKCLEVRGYIERQADEKDKRRAFLVLTRPAVEKLEGYLSEASAKLFPALNLSVRPEGGLQRA